MLQLSELKNLPVYTKSGKHLGRVVEVEIDPASQLIVRYHVSQWPKLTSLWQGRLLVAREQVVSITKAAMIVEDSLARAKVVPEATPAVG